MQFYPLSVPIFSHFVSHHEVLLPLFEHFLANAYFPLLQNNRKLNSRLIIFNFVEYIIPIFLVTFKLSELFSNACFPSLSVPRNFFSYAGKTATLMISYVLLILNVHIKILP